MKMKSHFHSVFSRKRPVSRPPMRAPRGGDAAKVARATFRAVPGGIMTVKHATALGMTIPPPMPVMARTATNDSYVVQKALVSEKTIKMVPPAKSIH